MSSIGAADVESAAKRIAPYVHRTALVHSATLSEMSGTDLWLKTENLQKTGAFKVRGAINAVMQLTSDEPRRGVITVSAGNHGMALAYAGKITGVTATVVMPNTAVLSKIAAIEHYGGHAVLVDGSRLMESMEEIRSEQAQIFIHPFDHPRVMAGQGTVGLEIVQELSGLDAVVVPVGGGGLLSGMATAVKARMPSTSVIGVEPEGSTAVSQSLEAARPVRLDKFATIADGLNAPWGGPNTLETIQRLVDRVVTVSDGEIIAALKLVAERMKLVVEPAGAAAVAALVSGKLPDLAGKRVVAVLSGGNVDLKQMAKFLSS